MPDDARPQQIPLDLGALINIGRDDLVVSSVNAAAVALVDRWPDWPAPVTILSGPNGAGKSHIASIWAQLSGAHRANAARITDSDIAAASEKPVLMDDVAAGGIDETGLFHLINVVRQSGTQLLLVSRDFPVGWRITLPDLASRLKASAMVAIGEPDDDLLAGVMAKLFADRQVDVEPHVIRFLVRRIERSLSSAIRVVDELDRIALIGKSRINRTLAQAVIAALELERGDIDDKQGD